MRSELEKLEKQLRERFVKAFVTYHLLEDGDHVLVGLSGGKDSLLLLEMLGKRAKISHPNFKVEAAHVRMENIQYESDTSYLEEFCKSLDVPLHIVTTRFEVNNDQSMPHQNRRKQKTALFPLLMEPPKTALQSCPTIRMQQNSIGTSSRRPASYCTAKPHLSKPLCNNARFVANEKNAP